MYQYVFVYSPCAPHRCLPGEREEQGAGTVWPAKVGAQRIRQNFARNDGNDRNGRSLKKSDFEANDPYIHLIEYKNTPISCMSYAQSQRLMSCILR